MSVNNDVSEWVRLADMDLKTAHHLFMTFHPKPLEIVCFHSQQAVEKILKCYLLTHNIEPPKTHDIQFLLEMCLEICNDFNVIYADATTLTNYAVRLRYPVELGLVESDAQKALETADKAMIFVKSKTILEKAQNYKYTSMNYLETDDVKDAAVLHDDGDMILLHDKSTGSATLHFAVNDFERLMEVLGHIPGGLRLCFVPKAFAKRLEDAGFTEWAEFIDFFNHDLTDTVSRLTDAGDTEYLDIDACEAVSALSHRCRLQSRGFEGESPEWFKEWLAENQVLVLREDDVIIGYCCVSIYDAGTMLWIRGMAVDPAHQGRGVAKQLMEQALIFGVRRGATKGFLHCDIRNERATGLYKKYGFRAKEAEGELQMAREELLT